MDIGTQFDIFLNLYSKRAIPETVNAYRITFGNLSRTPDNKIVTLINATYDDDADESKVIGSYAIDKKGYTFYGPCVGEDCTNRDEVRIDFNGLSGKLVELVSVENGTKKFIEVELSYNFKEKNALSFEEYLEGKFQEMYDLTHKNVLRI